MLRVNVNRNFIQSIIRTNSSGKNEIEFNKINNIALVTLNRPKQLNALNVSMARAFREKLKEFEVDSKVKAIVVKSSSEAAFCAGGDIKNIYLKMKESNKCKEEAFDFFTEEYKLVYQIANLKKPYIALMNGITFGAGAGLSIHAKYRIATEKTLVSMPEMFIGYIVDIGFFNFFMKLKDNISLYLGLTGEKVKGCDNRRLGIATHFVKEASLKNLENDLCTLVKENEDIEKVLKKYDVKCEGEFPSAHIHRSFNESTIEKIIENLETENTEFSRRQLKILQRVSPSSLKITMKQYEMEKSMSLENAMQLHYLLGKRIFERSNDMSEGVRTVLIDKYDKPQWIPATVNEKVDVDFYFTKRKNEDELIL